MPNIITVINSIGEEIEGSLQQNKKEDYFKHVILLYSLIENFIKFMVASKECWDESCKQVDEEGKGERYLVDFEMIKKETISLTLDKAISRAYKQKLINEELYENLHSIRKGRNQFIHQLWLYESRNNEIEMKEILLNLRSITMQLVGIFEWLMFEEIGVVEPETLEVL